tara:strand:+ start:337 stop:1386 length:1050 start_codon:yes stop_codon:yes gene_type:complete
LELNVTIEELRERKIFVATPMYGGQCHGMYAKASVDMSMMATQMGVNMKFYYLFNESLITRARNYLVDEFLRSDFTHMMFIDSDIAFNPNDVFALAALADPKGDKDIICGPYPKKCIAWERIAAAVKHGYAEEEPGALEQFVGDFVFNPAQGQSEINVGEPVEVLEGGTGFMMIQRSAFEKWKEAYPEYEYRPDHNRSEHFDGSRMIHAYFDTVIEDQHKRYLSEDYMFCQWARNIGLKVWMCPWMQLQHIGTYNFYGSIPTIAQLPNATHGGMMDAPATKATGNPGAVPLPAAPTPPPIGPTMHYPPAGDIGSKPDPDRAARRKADMEKRRKARRAAKKARQSQNKKK